MPSSQFTVAIEGFQGPLELLLTSIEKRERTINDIALAEVADDFIAYLHKDGAVPLIETTQFLLVASTLLLIKSRSLLPTLELTHEEQADIDDLKHRLALYKVVRHAARALKKQWGSQYLYTTKHRYTAPVMFTPSPDTTPEELLSAARRVIDHVPKQLVKPTARVERVINLDEVITTLEQRVSSAARDTFANVVAGVDRIEAIVGFLALLELVKRGSVAAQQDQQFTDIHLSVVTHTS